MKVDMYEASPEIAKYVNSVCDQFKKEGDGNITVSMSLAISLCAQVFLSCGGDINKGGEIGEMIKVGVMTTLDAYKDIAKVTNTIKGRMN